VACCLLRDQAINLMQDQDQDQSICLGLTIAGGGDDMVYVFLRDEHAAHGYPCIDRRPTIIYDSRGRSMPSCPQ